MKRFQAHENLKFINTKIQEHREMLKYLTVTMITAICFSGNGITFLTT
jgi:hypothetical protein